MSDKTNFQQDWLTISQFKEWLLAGKETTNDYCKRCSKAFELSNIGTQAVKSNAAGKFPLFLSCIML